jgi:hypothetical protein
MKKEFGRIRDVKFQPSIILNVAGTPLAEYIYIENEVGRIRDVQSICVKVCGIPMAEKIYIKTRSEGLCMFKVLLFRCAAHRWLIIFT